MNLLTSCWLLFLGSLVVVAVHAQQSDNTTTSPPANPCSEEGVTQCEQEENRLCYYVDDGTETCGACLEGFVEIPAAVNNTTSSDTAICWSIRNLTLELFLDRFQPQLLVSNRNSTTVQLRLQLLQEMAQFVSEHNRNSSQDYTLTLNGFSADLPEETRGLLGYRTPDDGRLAQDLVTERFSLQDDDEEEELNITYVNWVEQGAVTQVKDQGRCGCCWSISVAGAIEGAAAITTGYLQSISFQQMISCDEMNGGCNGGFPAAALLYTNNNIHGGMAILNDYPYTDGNGGKTTTTCDMTRSLVKVEPEQARVATFYGLSLQDDTTYSNRVQIMKRAVSRQPVAIALKSNCRTLMSYRRGVLTDDGGYGSRGCRCGPSDDSCLDHAVLLVGYNDDHSPPYWLIKNSWGKRWGEDGYFRVAQTNPFGDDENSWGLFGMLAEGVLTLQAFNSTAQVKDEPQVLRETWQKVLIAIGVFGGSAVLAIGLVHLKRWMFPSKQSSSDVSNGES